MVIGKCTWANDLIKDYDDKKERENDEILQK